mgnify:CR=1 FL=1
MATIASVGDLTADQVGFLLQSGESPGDRKGMRRLTSKSNQFFGTNLAEGTVRRLSTGVMRRERRRNGGNRSGPAGPAPPCIKVAPGSV